jgi:DNA polymerase III sliding clamp (beta) subunit (PCNA family)
MAKAKTQELKGVLEGAKPGLSSKESTAQAACFLLQEDGIHAYNDEIYTYHPIEIGVTGAVKAEELLTVINRAKDDEIQLSVGKGELELKGKRWKAGVVMEKEIRLPLPKIPKKGWNEVPQGFLKALRFCARSVETGSGMPVLSCIHFDKDRAESTDRFRISQFTFSDLSEDLPSLLLHSRSAREVLRFQAPKEYTTPKGWLHLRSKSGAILSCRTNEGEYPEVGCFFEDVSGVDIELPKAAAGVMERVRDFAKGWDEEQRKALVSLSPRSFRARIEGEGGWFEEDCPMKYKGAELSFAINPGLFLEILGETRQCRVGDAAVLFEGEEWKHLIVRY